MNDKVTVIPLQNIEQRNPSNPLAADNREDTAARVAAVLRYLQSLTPDNETMVDHVFDDVCYGRSLIYSTMIEALTGVAS
jgi:hypothetical protein